MINSQLLKTASKAIAALLTNVFDEALKKLAKLFEGQEDLGE